MKWEFTHKQLREYFDFLKTQGTTTSFADMENMESIENPIVVRHDVDLDLFSAYVVANIEWHMGINSTFFIRVASETYNIFSLQSRTILEAMCRQGFEIGLHFDPVIHPYDAQRMLYIEAQMLECVLPERYHVKSVSYHNPSTNPDKFPLEGYIDAYNERIWSDANYISDSCMNFRDKDPYEFVKNAARPVQILLHPIHYCHHDKGYLNIMRQHFRNKMDNLHADYRDNFTFVKEIGDADLADLLMKKENG